MPYLHIDLIWKSGTQSEATAMLEPGSDAAEQVREMAKVMSEGDTMWFHSPKDEVFFIRIEDMAVARIVPVS